MVRISTAKQAYAAGKRIGAYVVRKAAHSARRGVDCVELRNDALKKAYDRAHDHPSTAFTAAVVSRYRLWGPYNTGVGDAVLAYLRKHGCPDIR